MALESEEGGSQIETANALLRSLDRLFNEHELSFTGVSGDEISSMSDPGSLPEAVWQIVSNHPMHSLTTCKFCNRSFFSPDKGGGILLRSVVSIGVQQNAKSLNAVQTSPISAAQVTATIEQSITALNAVEVNAAEATQSPSQSHSHGLDYPSFQFLRLPHLAISQQGHFVLPDAQASKQPLLSARR